MATRKLFSKSVPRIELDHRARDARNMLVRMHRLLVPREWVSGFWLGPLGRLLGSRAGGNRQTDGRGSGSQNDPRLGCYLGSDWGWSGNRGAFC